MMVKNHDILKRKSLKVSNHNNTNKLDKTYSYEKNHFLPKLN